MSSANKAQAQSSAKRMQLSRDQKALLETVYAMEKLPDTAISHTMDCISNYSLYPQLARPLPEDEEAVLPRERHRGARVRGRHARPRDFARATRTRRPAR